MSGPCPQAALAEANYPHAWAVSAKAFFVLGCFLLLHQQLLLNLLKTVPVRGHGSRQPVLHANRRLLDSKAQGHRLLTVMALLLLPVVLLQCVGHVSVEAQLMSKESERLAAVMRVGRAEASAVAAQNELLDVTKR